MEITINGKIPMAIRQIKNEELEILPERDTTSSIITITELKFTLQISIILFFVFEIFWMVWCDG